MKLAADLQWILFDLDGTLRLNQPNANQVFFDHAVALGVPDSYEKRRRAAQWVHYYWAQSEELLSDEHLLRTEQEQQFWTIYAERSLLAFECTLECARQLAPEMQQYMDANYAPEDFVPEDVHPTLQALKDAGYHLGMLSNRSNAYNEQLIDLGLSDFFEYTLAAGEIAIWKPNPGIFQHALEQVGAGAQQTLYIGDNYYADILGAQAAGLRPVLYDPEQIFPDAGCEVIHQISQLQHILL